MPRTVKVTLNGTDWNMPVSFAVSKEIAEQIGDPLKLAIESHRTGTVPFSSGQVVKTISIGVRAAGCGLSEDAIGEAIFEVGLVEYLQVASEYIGAMVSGGPEKTVAAGGKKKTQAG